MMESIQRKIAGEIVERQKKKPEVVAITLFGSLARGKERKDSDVDIEIISKKAKRWRLLKKKKYGIEIDLVLCPKNHLLHQIKKYPYLCYDYLNQKIIYDPENFMKGIKRKLKRYFGKHPKIVKFWREKLKVMNENKKKNQDPKEAIKSYDEAEIKFSKEHKITRNFFRK